MTKRFLAVLLVVLACSDPAAPGASIAFKPDASTCSGSSAIDLFIDGSKVGSPVLVAGAASNAFQVASGSHVVSAKSVDSGAEWPSEQITVDAPTIYVLTCSISRPLMAFIGTIANRLTDPIVVVSGSTTDTIPATTSELRKFVGNGGFQWSPVPQRYSDGSVIPDDHLINGASLTPGGTTEITPVDALGDVYYTFTLTNSSAATIAIGVFSGISLRCVANLPASKASYDFGYYRLKSGVEVRAYRGADCTGVFVRWDTAALSGRDPKSGYIALEITTPP